MGPVQSWWIWDPFPGGAPFRIILLVLCRQRTTHALRPCREVDGTHWPGPHTASRTRGTMPDPAPGAKCDGEGPRWTEHRTTPDS